MSYSQDLRIKVIEYLQKGNSQRKAAEVFGINLTTVNEWNKKYKSTGEVKDKKPERTFKKLDPEKLETYIRKNPDAYLKEIGDVFSVSDMSVHRALKKLGITRKKRNNGSKSRILKK